MRLILIGMKGCGKTTIGKLLAKKLQIPFVDSDAKIEQTHYQERGEVLPFRRIFQQYGEAYFLALEQRTLKHIAEEFGLTDIILACGGRTPLQEGNQAILRELGKIIFLHLENALLLKRILAQGVPAFFPYQDDPARSLNELVTARLSVYQKLADMTVDTGDKMPEEVVYTILTKVGYYGKNSR
jgi:shikimate kinase